MYTLTQVERHRALTTKFSKAWGDSGWSPTRWIHWCLAQSTFFCREVEEYFSVFLHPWHGPYKRRLTKLFQGLVLGEAKFVPPPHAPLHVHERPEQGLLGLQAAKASNIDEFFRVKTKNALCQVFCVVCPSEGWRRGVR